MKNEAETQGICVKYITLGYMIMDSNKLKQQVLESRADENERLAQYIAERRGLDYIDPSINPSIRALALLKRDVAEEANVAVVKRKRKRIVLAVINPEAKKVYAVEESLVQRGFLVEKQVLSKKTLQKVFRFYDDIQSSSFSTSGFLKISKDLLEDIANDVKTPADVRKKMGDLQKETATAITSKIIEIVIGSSVGLGSTDIHIEPSDGGGARIRFRLDTVLVTIAQIEDVTYKKLLNRLKLLSGVMLKLVATTSDGRFSVALKNKTIDIRASFLPQIKKESVVLRILDKSKVGLDIHRLGIRDQTLALFKEQAARPTGMVLNTGPTSSGKTTTLYSFLKHVQKPTIKIVTLENPVEYNIEGIVQVNISKEVTFVKGLRSILRQNPNIILVGEIRDEEVARVAMDAAMTGHLVLSTLHTNDAAGALPRLIGFDIDMKSVSEALNLVIAQRLVRKLCKLCAIPHELSDEEKRSLEKEIREMSAAPKAEAEKHGLTGIKQANKEGCEGCVGGYKGLQMILEVLVVDEEIQSILEGGGAALEIRNIMRKKDFPLLHQDGILHVLSGTTSFSEVSRIVGFNL